MLCAPASVSLSNTNRHTSEIVRAGSLLPLMRDVQSGIVIRVMAHWFRYRSRGEALLLSDILHGLGRVLTGYRASPILDQFSPMPSAVFQRFKHRSVPRSRPPPER